jgi:hypothetical protein
MNGKLRSNVKPKEKLNRNLKFKDKKNLNSKNYKDNATLKNNVRGKEFRN